MDEAVAKSIKDSKLDCQRTKWTLKPILDPELTEEIELQDVYVGLLKEKRNISVAIHSISTILPGFNHLKRCSGNRLLLSPLNSVELIKEIRGTHEEDKTLTDDELKNILKVRGFDLSLLEDDLMVKQVPCKCPKTKKQAAATSSIWPVNFHPNPAIESIIDGSIFDEKQLQLIEGYMSLAIVAGKCEAVGNKDCTGSAVIVDPEDGRILAVAASRIDRHPMWHSAMLAVDLVARLQGGGAWNLQENCSSVENSNPVPHESSTDNVSSATQNETNVKTIAPDYTKLETCTCNNSSVSKTVNTEFYCTNKNDVPKERPCKRKHEESRILFYPPSLSTITLPPQESLVRKTKGRNKVATKCVNVDVEGKSSTEKCGPYLCTGYWVFLLKEPCPLCAMCLLHSRVSRIFYGAENKSSGVLGSRAVLHSLSGLNHRYNVWSGVLEETCRKVLKEIELKNVN